MNLLFGVDTIKSVKERQQKLNPCIALYGVTEGKTCKTCKHLISRKYSKRYYKCDLRKITAGPGTDHKVNWQACGKYEER